MPPRPRSPLSYTYNTRNLLARMDLANDNVDTNINADTSIDLDTMATQNISGHNIASNSNMTSPLISANNNTNAPTHTPSSPPSSSTISPTSSRTSHFLPFTPFL